jgi:hypothetical protein
VGRVRVELGVGVSMVGSVTSGPPLDGSLDGTCTRDGETILERGGSVVRSVSPQSVVTGGDTETSDVVVDHTRMSALSPHFAGHIERGTYLQMAVFRL